ncbi:YibE/F family protein [Streptomyces bathyalis]|uniref:YibE/F family protein n=1 Tax=Streptomyces bathyalis TaxID=2710756 RepID=A0A7T1TD13_9ACTN|nr:YibE/F family protein [Streptomyces bathyalis]
MDRHAPGSSEPVPVPGQDREGERRATLAHQRRHESAPGHGHSHAHSHGPPAPVSRHLRKVIAAVLIPFAVAVLAGLVVLWPGGVPEKGGPSGVGFDRPTLPARVTAVRVVDCKDVNAQPPAGQPGQTPGQSAGAGGAGGGGKAGGTCRKATVEVTAGKDKGSTFTEVITPDATRTYSAGQDVVVAYAAKAPPELRYSVIDVDRKLPMVLLAGIFALFVVLVGRLRGVLALVGLAVSFAVLSLFILPAILQGSNPLVVAVIGGSAIMLATLYLCHGLSARTSVAVLGTLISLLLIGVLGSLFIGWAHLTGNTDDQTGLVHGLFPGIGIQGLLLAGVLIGSLGVLDDVTVTQTSAVWELKEADPGAGWRRLYGSAMRIGRDHIASVVNTLVLAYAGAALPLMLLFSIARSGVTTVATSEVVAEEIVRTLVGSIGLVASVPVTTLLAALVVSSDRNRAVAAEGVPAGAAARTGAPMAVGAPGSTDPRAPTGPEVTTRRGGKRRKPK